MNSMVRIMGLAVAGFMMMESIIVSSLISCWKDLTCFRNQKDEQKK